MYSFGLNFRYVFGFDGMRGAFYRWVIQDRNTNETVFAFHHQKCLAAKDEVEIMCKRYNGISITEDPQRKAAPNYGYWYQEFRPHLLTRLPQLPKE